MTDAAAQAAKREWLRFSGWDSTPEDRLLRDRIAALFDRSELSSDERRLLEMADRHLTLQDLPHMAAPDHESRLRELADTVFAL